MEIRKLDLFGVTMEFMVSDLIPEDEIRFINPEVVRETEQIAATIAKYPQFFSYSAERIFETLLCNGPFAAKIINVGTGCKR
jgi:hypothetical protein